MKKRILGAGGEVVPFAALLLVGLGTGPAPVSGEPTDPDDLHVHERPKHPEDPPGPQGDVLDGSGAAWVVQGVSLLVRLTAW